MLIRILLSGTRVYGGGDVEIHRGKDGRGYAIDLARLLPPTAPQKPALSSLIFCNLFRPELMRRLKRSAVTPPLSSDTFAGWGQLDPSRKEREAAVRAATAFLFDVVIPEGGVGCLCFREALTVCV
jgi:hypothetical protein